MKHRNEMVDFISYQQFLLILGYLQKNIDIVNVKERKEKLWKECEDLEYKVFLDKKYIKKNPQNRITEYDDYIDNTEFIVAVENGKEVVGGMRIIYSPNNKTMGKGQFPIVDFGKKLDYTIKEAESNQNLSPSYEDDKTLWLYSDEWKKMMKLDPRKVLEFITMTVRKDKRDGIVSTLLYTELFYNLPKKNKNIENIFAVYDHSVAQRTLERGVPYKEIGPIVKYMGSKTISFVLNDFSKLPHLEEFQKKLK
jgi:N-acyl-L-homoserine lactone synthetase